MEKINENDLKNVLFICKHNSARSQMAEGYMQSRYGDRFMAYSAGTEITRINPVAVRVMKEIDIDISHQYSKALIDFIGKKIDVVITVCDGADSTCPFFPNAETVIHQSFSDPSQITGNEEEIRAAFRSTRDEIIAFIDAFAATDTMG
ncbi:MAG: arsenate reductase ArsC [Methanospirillaceae archaeon]|nr:arsenate reductase ArsC [Methanospirillaceae archaeon]